MKRLLAVFLWTAFVIQLHGDVRRIDPAAYIQHVKLLASDELEGRGDGAAGLEKAAEYIEKTFRDAGLADYASAIPLEAMVERKFQQDAIKRLGQ